MISRYYQTEKNGVIIHLKVMPNASRNELCGVINDADGQELLKVKVTAVADDGQANKALLKFLAKYWRVSASSIEIISGKTARRKKIMVKDAAFEPSSYKITS